MHRGKKMTLGRTFVYKNEDRDKREEKLYTHRGSPGKLSMIRIEEVWETGSKLEKRKIDP